jgi:6-pyruvoyltetrahydropterin/6-carboxytetrahydropterin synthase
VELSSAKLDRRGMVMDFEEIKQHLQRWVDESMDHRMLLRRDDPLVPIFRKLGEPVYLMDENPTAENIAREVYRVGRKKRLPVTRVTLWETEKSYATYEE